MSNQPNPQIYLPPPNPQHQAAKPWYTRWWIWVLFALVIVGVIVVIFMLLGGKQEEDISKSDSDTPTNSEVEPVETDPEPEPEPEPNPDTKPIPEPSFEAETFTGTGDEIIAFKVSELAFVTFICDDCEGPVILETNAGEQLLADSSGRYAGTHWINFLDDSVTKEFNVTASGTWELMVEPFDAAPQVTRTKIAGAGDGAFALYTESNFAEITNDGTGYFGVFVFGNGESMSLVLNEQGAYQGTVEFIAPGIVQVISDGEWSITIQE